MIDDRYEVARKRRAEGHTFVYACVLGNFTKIGVSTDPQRRLRHLQCGSPWLLTFHVLIRGDKEQESRWHAKFRDRHVHGEWFELDNQDIALMADHMSEDDRNTLRRINKISRENYKSAMFPYVPEPRALRRYPSLRAKMDEVWKKIARFRP